MLISLTWQLHILQLERRDTGRLSNFPELPSKQANSDTGNNELLPWVPRAQPVKPNPQNQDFFNFWK